jgi:hypothetical protein
MRCWLELFFIFWIFNFLFMSHTGQISERFIFWMKECKILGGVRSRFNDISIKLSCQNCDTKSLNHQYPLKENMEFFLFLFIRDFFLVTIYKSSVPNTVRSLTMPTFFINYFNWNLDSISPLKHWRFFCFIMSTWIIFKPTSDMKYF